jgi:hypothetical protein
MNQLNATLSGAGAMAALVVALFFLRFWRRTGDSFFVYFALSFAVEAALRAYMAATGSGNETSASVYLLRLASYSLLLVAIVRKNRRGRRSSSPPGGQTRTTSDSVNG